jgi:GTP cyclohydrolase II
LDYSEIARQYGKTVEEVAESVERARRSMVVSEKRLEVLEFGKVLKLTVIREGVGPLKTKQGVFYHFNFTINDKWKKYSVLVRAELTPDFYPIFKDKQNLMMRTDSGCETGQLFGDKTCECRDQLHKCMKEINDIGEGIIIHIPRQDGRGLGLPFKLGTLRLQEELGLDTYEASYMLDPNGSRDTRTYGGVVAILKFFEIPAETCINLRTNNAHKEAVLKENGYTVSPIGLAIDPTEDTIRHLRAKQTKMGHRNLVDEAEEEKA